MESTLTFNLYCTDLCLLMRIARTIFINNLQSYGCMFEFCGDAESATNFILDVIFILIYLEKSQVDQLRFVCSPVSSIFKRV